MVIEGRLAERRNYRTQSVLLVFLLLFSPFALAKEADSGLTFWQFQWENDDIFPNPYSEPSDRYYTNGLRFSWATSDRKAADEIRFWGAHKLAEHLCDKSQNCVSPSYAFGQNFYTPENITVASRQPADRPWAGWLYVSRLFAITPSPRSKHDLEFQLGVTGSASGAEFVQAEWHDLINSDPPAGWDNQFDSEIGGNLFYGYQHIFSPKSSEDQLWGWDFVPGARFALGTIQTNAGVNATFRAGRNITGFPYDPIKPSLVELSDRKTDRSRFQDWEAYIFVGGEARYVGHNYFLEGSLFGDDPGVNPNREVWDFYFGASVRIKRWRVTYSVIRRGEEFDPRPGSSSGIHNFASVALSHDTRF